MSPIVLPPISAVYLHRTDRSVIYQVDGGSLSKVASELRERLAEALAPHSSATFGQRRWDLEAACSEASKPNWDGYGAEPVSLKTFRQAVRFLESIPLTIPNPEISVDPDGEVSFTWSRSPRQVFSVSIGEDGRLSYSGLHGDSTIYGTEWFHDALPDAVEAAMARVFPSGIQADPPARAA